MSWTLIHSTLTAETESNTTVYLTRQCFWATLKGALKSFIALTRWKYLIPRKWSFERCCFPLVYHSICDPPQENSEQGEHMHMAHSHVETIGAWLNTFVVCYYPTSLKLKPLSFTHTKDKRACSKLCMCFGSNMFTLSTSNMLNISSIGWNKC